MAIETPVQVLQRLREQARQERLARAKAPAEAFTRARTGKEKASAFGQQIGTAIAQAFTPEQDIEQSPELIQAKVRQRLLNVAPDDVAGMKRNIKIATEMGDYEVGKYLTDMYFKARQAASADVRAEGKGKGWKYKTFTGEDRKLYGSQVVNAFDDANLEEGQVEPTSDAVVAAAENLWNLRREQGDSEFTKAEAISMASKFARNYVVDDWGYNSFDSAKFTTDFADTVGRYRGAISGETAPARKKQGIPKGTRKGDYIFMGNENDNPNDKKLWKKIKLEEPKETKKEKKPLEVVDIEGSALGKAIDAYRKRQAKIAAKYTDEDTYDEEDF